LKQNFKAKKNKNKHKKGFVLPLSFSIGIKLNLSKVKLKRKTFKWKYILTQLTVITLITFLTFIYNYHLTKAATFYFNQSSWSGGQTTNDADHNNHQTGWDEYENKDNNLVAGSDLQLSESAISITDTSDVDFNDNTSINQTEVSGSGDTASLALEINNEPDSVSLTPPAFPSPASATKIYRSVGPSATSSLATGASNDLTISSSVATFSTALDDNIGVGDAIQYDSDNNGSIDSVVFIHGRIDSAHYTVKTVAGASPSDLSTADNDWSIYRAYTSLANAETGNENDSLDDAIENFEAWSGGRDLVTNDEQWNIACYANGTTADDTIGYLMGWDTAADNYIRIYTPTRTSEVGTSQRHAGVWDDSKYKIETTTTIRLYEAYIRVDGLQIKGGTINYENADAANGEEQVSNCILDGNDVVSRGIMSVRSGSTAKVLNNVFYGFTNAAIVNTGSDIAGIYAYNNTIYDCAIGIYGASGSQKITAKNNLIANTSNPFDGSYTSETDYNMMDNSDTPPGGVVGEGAVRSVS
jgi:hypothetical protein